MTQNIDDQYQGIWFVYDGECPMCTSVAHALRIKKEFGTLNLLNAREAKQKQPYLWQQIVEKGYDLDEGMVIYYNDTFYHGQNALKFMARYSAPQNIFTSLCKSLFWSNAISKLTYPWMRGTRNFFLKRKQIGRIDNLALKDQAIFESIFSDDWHALPPAMKKHYANRPYTKDQTIVEGQLDFTCNAPLKYLGPLMKLMGQIPASNEKNVAVKVIFKSDMNDKSFHFNRYFNFQGQPPYLFKSRMVQIKNNEVAEIMRLGLCWKMLYKWDGEKVILKHNGYALKAFGHFIPLPLTPILGKGYAEEKAINDNSFEMVTHITHTWWGKVYEYKGQFEVKKHK